MTLTPRVHCLRYSSQSSFTHENSLRNRMLTFATCKDHEATGEPCKHVCAALYVMHREKNPDGSTTVTETLTIAKRTTYSQDWANYDMAQTTEKHRFQELLFDLCSRVPQPERKPGRGRPKTTIADAVFSACLKVYSTVSTR